MAKKRNADSFSVKDSMIYERSDRKKADEDGASPKKPKSKAKIFLVIFIAAVILFVGVPWIVVTIIDSPLESIQNDGLPKHSFEQLLEATEATEHSTALFNMKSPDLNNTAKVTELLDYLNITDELGGYTFSVKNDAKPYSITLRFNLSHDIPDDGQDMWEQTMIKYSCAIMSLCNNIAQVNWEYPAPEGGNSGAYFTRADAEELYNLGVPATKFAQSETAVQLMLNQLGIDIY